MPDNVTNALQQNQAVEDGFEGQLPPAMQEFGTTGLRRIGGVIGEEFLLDLRGVQGIKKFKEMYDNDPIAGGMIFAITRILGRLPWEIQAKDGTDPEVADFVQSCFEDMDTPWPQVLEDILSMCTYGWAFLEMNLKLRQGPNAMFPWQQSKFTDGRLGWRSMRIRSQDTLVLWEFADNGDLLGLTQLDPNGGGMKTIPLGKGLLFRTTTFKDNPEGRSLLRSAYRPWSYKKRIEDYEAIGVERDLAGLPLATLPVEYFAVGATPEHKQTLRVMQDLVSNIRQDASGGVVMPVAFDSNGNKLVSLELMGSPGAKGFDTDKIITRKSNEMAQSILMDFMMLGHDNVGSFALGAAKIDLWTMAVEAVAKAISATFNKYAIDKLLRWNRMPTENPPELVFGEVSNVDLAELGDFVQKMVMVGALVPDEELLKFVRTAAKIPESSVPAGFDVNPNQ